MPTEIGNRESRAFITGFVEERFNSSFDYWDEVYYQRLRDFDDYYHVRLPEVLAAKFADDERSDLVPPDIHLLTNDFRAQLVLPFYRKRQIAKLIGRGPQDVRNEAFAQMLFDWHLEITDFWREFDLDAYSIATKGFTVGMIELKPVIIRSVTKGGEVKEEELFGGAPIPFYRHLDPLKFYPDPTAKRLRWPECRFVCYQAYMTREQLYTERANNRAEWVFDDDELQRVFSRLTRDEREYKPATERFRNERRTPNDPIPVTWYVGDVTHPDRPNDFQQAVVGIADSALLFFSQKKMPMNYVEFFQIMGINPEDDRLLSMGKIEAIEDTFLELYTKRNQAVDITNVGAYGLTFVQRGHGIPEAHRVGPYTFIELDNPAQVQTFAGQTGAHLLGEVGYTRNELRDAYGSNYALGLNPEQRESATGANILVEQQSKQQVQAVMHIWNSGLRHHCELKFMMLQLHTPNDVWIRLSEDPLEPLQRVTRDQVLGRFNFSLAVGVDDFMPEAVRQARMERVVAMYRDDPDIDQLELKRKHLQVMGLNDAELLIVSQDEKTGWARAETALILRYGIAMPLWGGEDHMIHAQTHLQGIISAIDLAAQDQLLAANIRPLMEHFDMHIRELQATQGLDVEQSVMPRGMGGFGQARADLGPDLTNRIQATRSEAQKIAHDRGAFQ